MKITKYYAFIGSTTPTALQIAHAQEQIRRIKADEGTDGIAIVSGCADGIDAVSMECAHEEGFYVIGCLPWHKYNPEVQKFCNKLVCLADLPPEWQSRCYDSVKKFHPYAATLKQGPRKLHARNYLIVYKVAKTFAMPSLKPGYGGTGQGIRISRSLGTEVEIFLPDGGYDHTYYLNVIS